MKLVTICENRHGIDSGFAPGKCKIGIPWRPIWFSTGLILIGLSVISGPTPVRSIVWQASQRRQIESVGIACSRRLSICGLTLFALAEMRTKGRFSPS